MVTFPALLIAVIVEATQKIGVAPGRGERRHPEPLLAIRFAASRTIRRPRRAWPRSPMPRRCRSMSCRPRALRILNAYGQCLRAAGTMRIPAETRADRSPGTRLSSASRTRSCLSSLGPGSVARDAPRVGETATLTARRDDRRYAGVRTQFSLCFAIFAPCNSSSQNKPPRSERHHNLERHGFTLIDAARRHRDASRYWSSMLFPAAGDRAREAARQAPRDCRTSGNDADAPTRCIVRPTSRDRY